MVEYKLPKLGVAGSNPVARFVITGNGPKENPWQYSTKKNRRYR